MTHNAENDAVPHGPDNPCEPKCHGWGIGCPCNPRSAENDVTFAERVGDRHFPWHYFGFGVECACGRPCDSNEDCEVMRRARRWEASATRVLPPGQDH